MKIEYKGFTISQSEDGRYYLPANVGNSDGYATLNNAKGAITKYLQSLPANDVSVRSSPCADVVQIPLVKLENLLPLMRYHGMLKANGKPRKNDKRSRNKREGRYVGKLDGKHLRCDGPGGVCSVTTPLFHAATRKARKATKMQWRKIYASW